MPGLKNCLLNFFSKIVFFSFKSRLLVFLAQKKYPQTTIERKSDNEPSLAITEFYLNPRAVRKIPFCLSRVWLLRFPAFLSCRKLHFSMFSSIYNAYRKNRQAKKTLQTLSFVIYM